MQDERDIYTSHATFFFLPGSSDRRDISHSSPNIFLVRRYRPISNFFPMPCYRTADILFERNWFDAPIQELECEVSGARQSKAPTWFGTHIHESFAYLKNGMEWASFDPETAPTLVLQGNVMGRFRRLEGRQTRPRAVETSTGGFLVEPRASLGFSSWSSVRLPFVRDVCKI